jgi:hypothetical protein
MRWGLAMAPAEPEEWALELKVHPQGVLSRSPSRPLALPYRYRYFFPAARCPTCCRSSVTLFQSAETAPRAALRSNFWSTTGRGTCVAPISKTAAAFNAIPWKGFGVLFRVIGGPPLGCWLTPVKTLTASSESSLL